MNAYKFQNFGFFRDDNIAENCLLLPFYGFSHPRRIKWAFSVQTWTRVIYTPKNLNLFHSDDEMYQLVKFVVIYRKNIRNLLLLKMIMTKTSRKLEFDVARQHNVT